MNKIIKVFAFFFIIALIILNREVISSCYMTIVKFFTSKTTELERNEYYRNYDFMYVHNTDQFIPHNKQELVDVLYTIINSGEEMFTFYCSNEYKECRDDVRAIANDQTILSHINNYVHPYNSFKHIETQFTDMGEVTITLGKVYSKEEIELINQKVDEIILKNIRNDINVIDKIKIVHDYIISNSRYDTARAYQNNQTYKSDIAYGPLFQGHAICSGYSDAMELFLEKFGVKSYKISSENHVWNAVYLNDRWYHLDLTWDDPVTDIGIDLLEYNYFLIDNNKLKSKKDDEHFFDKNYYLEFNY